MWIPWRVDFMEFEMDMLYTYLARVLSEIQIGHDSEQGDHEFNGN